MSTYCKTLNRSGEGHNFRGEGPGGGFCGPGAGFGGPGGGFLVLVAVVACHYFYYH